VILDNETQKIMILEIIKQSNFSGQSLDEAYELKKSIENAKIQDEKLAPK
jgi:hypothetical protein